MKYVFQIVLFSLYSIVSAQEKHFVFIQSDNQQPFYVSLNKKLYSSTASGYVIIPKLSAGEYNITIGFANNTFPEQGFRYVIDKRDLGFNLKNFGEKGWGLFDLQTLAVTMSGEVRPDNLAKNEAEQSKEDYRPEISFERKKESEVAKTETTSAPSAGEKKEEKSPDHVLQPNSSSTHASTNAASSPTNMTASRVEEQNSSTALQAVEQSEVNKISSKSEQRGQSVVKKVDEVKGSMGVYQTYVDSSSAVRDTVQIIIPGSEIKKVERTDPLATSKKVKIKEKRAADKASEKNEELKFLSMEVKGEKSTPALENNNAQTQSTAQTLNKDSDPTGSNKNVAINSNCTNTATEEDYVRLRRKMATVSTDEGMISEAKKVFRKKCFTTSQIKGLSTLFMSDEGRYKFFDASYNFAADAQVYSSLEKEFIDPYFVNRFKAMLRH